MRFAIVDSNKIEASKGAKGFCQSCPAVRSLPLNIDKLVLSVVCDYGFRIK